jgi:hypothetical protein
MRFYRYVVASDFGMAPCGDDGLLSLATCKPVIRRVARPGDFVAGFAPSPAPPGRLVYAAQVSEVVEWRDYCRRYTQSQRRDSVYDVAADGTWSARRSVYHEDLAQQSRDLSSPVLIFDPKVTWYFGDQAQTVPDPLVRWAVGGSGALSGRGHRVDEVDPKDPNGMLAWLLATFAPGWYGQPRSGRSCC